MNQKQFNYLARQGQKVAKRDMYYLIVGIVVVMLIGVGLRHVKYNIEHESVMQEIGMGDNPELKMKRNFVKRISKAAIHSYRRNYQILPSVVIAQAIIESNWGDSKLYQVANNPFGIKGKYEGESVAFDTEEVIHGKKKMEKSLFRKYPNLFTAVNNHDKALRNNFIIKNHVMSYRKQAKMLQENRYATDPHYAEKLISVIKEYHLNQYDLKAVNDN